MLFCLHPSPPLCLIIICSLRVNKSPSMGWGNEAFIYEPVRAECLSQGMTETRKKRIKPGGKFVLIWGRCDKTHLWREKEASEVFDGFCWTATRLPNYYMPTWFKICILRKLLRFSWTSCHPPAPGFALLGMWTPVFQFTNVVLAEVIFGNCPLIFITSIEIWVALLNKASSFCLKWILTENETFLLQVLISQSWKRRHVFSSSNGKSYWIRPCRPKTPTELPH